MIKKIINNLLSRLFVTAGWLYGFLVFRVMNRVDISGRENVPRDVNVLFVANHQTLIDSFLLGMALAKLSDVVFHYNLIPWNAPDQMNFFSKPMFRLIFRYLKTIPVTRGLQTKQTMLNQLKQFGQKLQRGTLLLFFEGTRTRTGEINACKSGVAEIIYEQRPIVIPVLLDNVQPIMPLEVGFHFAAPLKPFKHRVKGRLIIGQPINFNSVFDQEKSRARKIIAQQVREAVVNLK